MNNIYNNINIKINIKLNKLNKNKIILEFNKIITKNIINNIISFKIIKLWKIMIQIIYYYIMIYKN